MRKILVLTGVILAIGFVAVFFTMRTEKEFYDSTAEYAVEVVFTNGKTETIITQGKPYLNSDGCLYDKMGSFDQPRRRACFVVYFNARKKNERDF